MLMLNLRKYFNNLFNGVCTTKNLLFEDQESARNRVIWLLEVEKLMLL
jgi:hypothetical protein